MKVRRLLLLPVLMAGVLSFSSLALAGQKAYYFPNADRLFWFMVLSDIHIGADSTAAANLTWSVTEARGVISPHFIVSSGDLTDSTNGGVIPNGPYQSEWDAYRNILDDAGMSSDFYYDMPGNHDHYNDAAFAFYLANSVQGRATGRTQPSWTRQFPFGRYHFKGVCTPGNDGAPFSFSPSDNFGDHAGLDESELADIEADLQGATDVELTLIFGHHPFEPKYFRSIDTGLTYGLSSFLALIDEYLVPFYGFGHTHNYRENFRASFDTTILNPGIYYMNVDSLGESTENQYTVMAIDGNGLSMVPAQKDLWPVVMITAPMDRCLGTCENPYTYEVPQKPNNPIRALVFDPNPVSQVQFSIDGSPDWQDMQRRAGTPVWEGTWNAISATAGVHTVTVRAQGSTLVMDSITTSVNPALPRTTIAPATLLLLGD